jgi:hypothetical protein
MKIVNRSILLPLLVATLIIAGTGRSLAHYDHDDKGWVDGHHQHHPYIMHNGHRGYWDQDDHGAKIFISI